LTIALIVDTSALVAIGRGEAGADELLAVLTHQAFGLPAPALVELHRVMAIAGNRPDPELVALLAELDPLIIPFGIDAAAAAVTANEVYGSGNGRGGPLNMLDLMVYATAKVMRLPILCTGKDFAATDAILHPASRRD
jgi:ribonuclease VapC